MSYLDHDPIKLENRTSKIDIVFAQLRESVANLKSAPIYNKAAMGEKTLDAIVAVLDELNLKKEKLF